MILKFPKQTAWLAMVLLFFTAAACSDKNEANDATLISSTNSKTWKVDRQRNATGDKEDLTKEERSETLVFYSNGTFSMNLTDQQQSGKWNYDPGTRNLSLEFEGADVSQNFEVQKLSETEMDIKAPDGSVLELETE